MKSQHIESIKCISNVGNSETKVTETNVSLNRSRKSQHQDLVIFYGKIKC